MNNIRISYIQADLVWEDSRANLKRFECYLKQIKDVDLVILPEMFNTGFSANVKKLAQSQDGKLTQWLMFQSKSFNFAIMGSAIIEDSGKYYNRLLMASPDGELRYYDKRHLFRMGGEDESFDSGRRVEIFNYLGWRIRPLICYDLRFPVWSRNVNNYDLLIYVANWPAVRSEVWKTLLKARAIENQSYVVGVNRVGSDGMKINYSGNSMVVDPKGNAISEIAENTEGFNKITLSLDELIKFREKFPVHLDADDFKILGVDR
ncbi:MAG TPA: amidohydrolase [Victivallales bacterium]|nr:amidohydrolase [Victivallales bacterium]